MKTVKEYKTVNVDERVHQQITDISKVTGIRINTLIQFAVKAWEDKSCPYATTLAGKNLAKIREARKESV